MRPPLDTHAHIKPDIARHELEALGAYVVAVTRTPAEYQVAARRDDRTTAWALGCHPGLVRPHKTFDPDAFQQQLGTAALVGEVGLDGASRVPMGLQTANFKAILQMLRAMPLVASVHSAGATADLLNILEPEPPPGLVLHWWRGTRDQTARAVELGCYFSVNSRDLRNPAVVGVVPRDRVLTETDHPAGDRSEPPPHRPGHMPKITAALAREWAVPPDETVQQIWRNWRELTLTTHTADRLPPDFQREMLAA